MFDLLGLVQGRRAGRQQTANLVECALRNKGNIHPSLKRRWTHGEAELSLGRITVTRRFLGGLRILPPLREPIEVRVRLVSAPLKTTTGLNFSGTIYEIETPDGILEWGLGAVSDHAWAINQVTPG